MICSTLTKIVIRQVKDQLLQRMKSKYLEQNLQVIIHFHHLVEKSLFHMQVSKMISKLLFMHYIFSKIMLFKTKTCMFIESPLHRTHENNQERNWHSQERPYRSTGIPPVATVPVNIFLSSVLRPGQG